MPQMLVLFPTLVMADAGVSLGRVALLLGHRNLNTTARYTRPTEADLEAAVDLLG